MENTNYVEFKRERDLGAIITDTFKFIRENWKAYFGTIIKIAGPFMLVGLIIMAYAFTSFSGFFSDLENIDNDTNGLSSSMPALISGIGILILVGIAVYVLVSATSLYYIKSYIDNNGNVDFTEVRKNTFKNIWKFLGLGIAMMLMVIIGMVLCYIPGIYIAIVMSLSTSVMVFENKGISDTISHSFKLIKDHWWSTFGIIFLVSILVGVLGSVFSVPAFIYQMAKMATISNETDALSGLFGDPIYIGLNILSYAGKFILSSITLIATVFVYYDLNEQKNLTGTLEKIDSLGQ